jgi:hypothetical protein
MITIVVHQFSIILLSCLISACIAVTVTAQQFTAEAFSADSIYKPDIAATVHTAPAMYIKEWLHKKQLTEAGTIKNKEHLFRFGLLETLQTEFSFWNDSTFLQESDTLAIPRMKTYWAAIGLFPAARQLHDSLWQERNPWSAAFISWVMKTAGAGNKFRYAKMHAEYIVWARNNARKKNNLPKAYAVNDQRAAWPQPGDLLCKNRNGKSYSLSSLCSSCISHCDIVLEVDTLNGIITTIGGNVKNRVNKTLVYVNRDGFIDIKCPSITTDKNGFLVAGNQQEYFAVIRMNWKQHK